MLKLLILLPLIIIGGALALPLLAIAPLLLIIGLAIALPLLILRVVFGVLFGIGHLFVGVLGFGFALVGGVFLLIFGLIAAHLILPLLLLAGLIWLIRHAARPAPLQLEHHPG